jgi:hypothetical protein
MGNTWLSLKTLGTGVLAVSALTAAAQGQDEIFQLDGNPGDRLGAAVANAGDTTGNGDHEIVVGAPGFSSGAGRVRILNRAGTALHTLSGAAGDAFGASVSGGADFNSDGKADIFVGAPGAGGTGQALLISGVDGTTLFTFSGDLGGDNFGAGVAVLDDIDSDSIPDLAVGAPGPLAGTRTGYLRLFSGTDGSLISTISSANVGDQFGAAVACAGDYNKDTVPDILVGAPHDIPNGDKSGSALVISGFDGSTLVSISGANQRDRMGTTVAPAGDIDEDDFADVLVGAIGDARNGTSGYIRVISGSDNSVIYEKASSVPASSFGSAVAGGLDVNGDDIPDFAVGSIDDNSKGNSAGSARLYNGATGRLLYTFDSDSAGATFGSAVALSPASSGDGAADIAIGATRDVAIGTPRGSLFLYAGNDLFLNASPRKVSAGQNLQLRTSAGPQGNGNALFVVSVNGIPSVSLVLIGSYNANEVHIVSGPVPNGLGVIDIEFLSIGINSGGGFSDSAGEVVSLQ